MFVPHNFSRLTCNWFIFSKLFCSLCGEYIVARTDEKSAHSVMRPYTSAIKYWTSFKACKMTTHTWCYNIMAGMRKSIKIPCCTIEKVNRPESFYVFSSVSRELSPWKFVRFGHPISRVILFLFAWWRLIINFSSGRIIGNFLVWKLHMLTDKFHFNCMNKSSQ